MALKNRPDPLQTLYGRPGFLLRRANQIAAALFTDAVAEQEVTTTQFGALMALSARGEMDQATLARLLRLDRSTTGLVVANLEKRGAISRTEDESDRRRRLLTMTPQGRALLERLALDADRVPTIELSPFEPDEAREFLRLLTKFVTAFDPDPELHPAIEPERSTSG
jgi:DNA-binding MarR family transcriptional regulator